MLFCLSNFLPCRVLVDFVTISPCIENFRNQTEATEKPTYERCVTWMFCVEHTSKKVTSYKKRTTSLLDVLSWSLMGYYWTKLIYNCHYYCYPYLVLLLCLDFMDSLENRRDFIWCLPWAVTRYPRVQRLWKLIFCGEGAALSPGHFSTRRTLSLNQRNPRT